MKRTFLKDLADAAGVSVSQASRALSGKPAVAPEVRQRIHELARTMNYRNLSNRHPVTIAILIAWMDDFTCFLFNALEQEARKNRFRISVIPPQDIKLLDEWLFDGVISVSGRSLIANWHERYRLPLVAINSCGNLLDRIPGVFSDGGFRLAMNHLVGLGHRRIAFLHRGKPVPSRDGERGPSAFHRFAREWGVEGESRYLYYLNGAELDAALRSLLAEGFTAFIDIASENGARLIRLIQDCGKRIPEDVSLITFENAAVSGFLSPALTTLGYDYPAMARNAISLMLQALRNGSGLHSVKLPTALTVRASTGPAPG